MTGKRTQAQTTASKSGMTLQTEKFKIAILFKNSPQFFKISFTALHGLEHKIIIQKSEIKNHLLARQKYATSAVRLT